MKFFKKALAGVAVVVAVGAFAPAPTQATSETDGVCYETVMVEWIQKMTRTLDENLVWSQWTFWDGNAFPDDGRFRGPAAHNNVEPGTPGYREYKYNVNGTLPTQVEVPCPEPTVPPVTEPPVTEPPVTEPPVTEPPVTEPPVTEPAPTVPQPTDIVFDPCYEDEPCWDCETMGNNQCGTVVTDIADPPSAPEATAAPTLPATGNETTYIALAALAALTAGLILVKVVRR